MEVYEGYRLFRRNGGIIALSSCLEIDHRGQIIWDETEFRPIIFLNKDDPLEEKVKTLIHELMHLAPCYLRYAARGEKLPADKEDEIERKTLDFYQKRPFLVGRFRRLAQEVEEESNIVYAA